MKVILLQDVRGIGRKYDMKEVSDGYARNFLLPRQLAKVANDAALKELRTKIADHEKGIALLKEKLATLQNEFKREPLTFKLKLGEKAKAFGSVTKKDIEEKIKPFSKDLELEVTFHEPIKTLGEHDVEINLGRGVTGVIKVRVEKDLPAGRQDS